MITTTSKLKCLLFLLENMNGSTMKINVKESCTICPGHETPKERQYLSNLDLFQGTTHGVPLVFLYKPNGCSNFFDTTILKEALSKVLVAFYPVAGRLGQDENGRIELNCNGEGVLFREAETDILMHEVGDFIIPSETVKQLIPAVDRSNLTSSPLFVAQVTRFKCGGVCLGIEIHHFLGDGTATLNFVNTWSDMARGLPIAVQPLLDRTIFHSRNPPKPTFNHIEYAPPPTLKTQTNSQPKTYSLVAFNLTAQQLNALKAKAHNPKSKYSTFEIITAHTWKCVCKARNHSDDQETKLSIPLDGRSRLNPPIPAEYFGNAIFHVTPVALCGEIVAESFTETADRIHKELKRRNDEYLRSAIDYLETVGDKMITILRSPQTMNNPNLKVTSWTKLPFENADFGWGKPLNIRTTTKVEGKGNLLPSPNEDGGLSLVICLEEDHMKSFKKLFYQALLPSRI